MSKKLVLAEKPSVARDIARVLQCNKKGNGFFEGSQYIVTWAMGHLVTLADTESYDTRYKQWNLEDLPILPNHLKTTVIKKTGKQFSTVKNQLHRNDVNEIVIATDAGREGELVARWIILKAGVKKPIKRLWISSVTDQAIKKGFQNLQDGKKYENLYYSAVARSEADWLVGINATRALTTKHNAQLSCGRVQTPTVAIIAKREEEVKNFIPKDFYGLEASINGVSFQWRNKKNNDTKVFSKEQNTTILKSLEGKQAEIIDVNVTNKKTYAPALYDLTELQRDAHHRFNFSAKETLNILQKLYEQHKLVTYPRTDSRYLSSDIVGTLKERLEAVKIRPYSPFASKILAGKITASSHFINDQKVSDHHALIPTEETPILSDLSDKERRIYDLIVSRFLAVLLPPYEYSQMTITASINGETFTTVGKTVKTLGWKEVYGSDELEHSQTLLSFKKGERFSVNSLRVTSGKTTPPAYLTEGTLLSAMENPAQFLKGESKELIQTLGDTGGLGTVATRADIIEKLFSSFLIEQRGKSLHVTSKGKQLLKLAPQDLKSPLLTAEWEKKLQAIAKGSLKKEAFVQEMKEYTKIIVAEIKGSEEKFKHDNITGSRCPNCGKFMLEVNGKKGKMLVCQDRECNTKKNISKVTNSRCPNCHKKLELRGEGDGQMFYCVCGHREKLSTFKQRKEKEKKGKISKKDINKYMKNQSQDEPLNTALGDALKNFFK